MKITINSIKLKLGSLYVEPIDMEVDGLPSGSLSEDKPNFGTVVNSSSEQYPINTVVHFRRDMYSSNSINGKVYFLLHEEDIEGTVEVQ